MAHNPYGIFGGRQSRWGDRQSWTLEERLPHLFREVEMRLVIAEQADTRARIEAERKAAEKKRRAEERERQWHVLMDAARARLVEAQRVADLRRQVDAWHEAERLRRYCDAVEAAYSDRLPTIEWLAWARDHIDRLDPLREPPVLTEPEEETTDALQRHLPDGWSAKGAHEPDPRVPHHRW